MHGVNIVGNGSRVFLAQDTPLVNLDGPLLLAKERQPGLHFEGGRLFPPYGAFWV